MEDKAPFLDTPQYSPDDVTAPQDLKPTVLAHSTNPEKRIYAERNKILRQVNDAK